jgi:hypothetical protein
MGLSATLHTSLCHTVLTCHHALTVKRYYVAHFLLERFAAERPDDYRIILSQLLSKAVESNNEQLVSNPYFQFRAILELSASKKS